MTTFELEYITFEQNTLRHQLSTTFLFTIEEVFETLNTAYVYMSTAHYFIDPFVNRNFGNTFHHRNVPNNVNTSIKTQVNSINPDTFRD